MEARRFDRLAQTLASTGSRRTALAALLATAGSALGLGRWQRAAAQPINCSLKANGERC